MFAEDPARAKRKRQGKLSGIVGLLLLFGSALSIVLLPPSLWPYLMIPLAAGATVLVVGYLLVR